MRYPLKATHSARRDGEYSMYARACPTCQAEPWCYCTTKEGKNLGHSHASRSPVPKPEPIGDLRAWWQWSKRFEANQRRVK
jgi:hypothetical protein